MRRRWAVIAGALPAPAAVVSAIAARAQRDRGQETGEPALRVADYTPRSTLVVDANPVPRERLAGCAPRSALVVDADPVPRARFPVAGAHGRHRPRAARRLDRPPFPAP